MGERGLEDEKKEEEEVGGEEVAGIAMLASVTVGESVWVAMMWARRRAR